MGDFQEEYSHRMREGSKKGIQGIHKYAPKYIFLAESTSILPGYEMKEALRKAYPGEPLPKFYRIDPRQVRKVMEAGKKVVQGNANEEDRTYFESKKEELQEFLKKRIADRDAHILVYDQDWSTGKSPASIVALLKNPEIYGFNSEVKSQNVKMNDFGSNVREDTAREFDIHPSDILPSSTLRLESDDVRITYKERPNYGSNFRRPRIKAKDGLPLISLYKKAGRELGEELHAEIEKKKSLEQKVSSVVAIAGIVSSLFFISSNVTGNAIANISFQNSSFLGAGLLVVGLVAGFFWVKSRKK